MRLRIEIEDERGPAATRQQRGKIKRCSGLAYAAFLIENNDFRHWP